MSKVILSFVFIFLVSCSVISPVETFHKKGLEAEKRKDFKVAAEQYRLALDAANKKNDYSKMKLIQDDLIRVGTENFFKGKVVERNGKATPICHYPFDSKIPELGKILQGQLA